MNYLLVDHLSLTFKTAKGTFPALREVSFTVNQGEIVSIIGHSGCGKSTVLNVIAGLLPATIGGVILEGREINSPGPERAVVFQNHSLLPWLSVYENIKIAVDQVFAKTKTLKQRDAWVRDYAHLVHLEQALHKKPHEISGGMKQRVGIARALAMQPKVLLMDEPFGALDALTRAHLQDVLLEIQQELGNTIVMITHDVDEAVLLSDKIIMMTNGPSATVGEILTVPLARPRNRLALANDVNYHHCRAAVLQFLYEKHRKAA